MVKVIMVKGVSRRVIVVKEPDPRFFEEAIFVVKEDAFSRDGVSAEQILQEARQVARGYIRRSTPTGQLLSKIPPPVYLALGGLLATAVWCTALFCL
ncbi:translation initiation factor 2 [Pseudoflavonifractor phocaeensis]|uniref:translation initiation factor 2 n=1 Tax=Pseudoflavonifractor phocaeensis TaxID=1870988 RepID=UPI001FAF8F78|nr:translation initiation factor 2 [Pseudoflavonifractor phocaeensis]